MTIPGRCLIARRPTRDFAPEWTWNIGQWMKVNIVDSFRKQLHDLVNALYSHLRAEEHTYTIAVSETASSP